MITSSQAQLTNSKARTGPQYAAALAATLGALAAGTMLGWTSPVEQKLATEYGFEISDKDFAWIGSLATLGAAIICYPIGFIMEKIGRKLAMLGLILPFTLGWLLIILATNVPMLMAGRFFTGLAGGAFCVTAPAYNSEIAQDEIRGTIGTFFQLMITVGILFAYAVGGYTKVWIFSLICAVIPIVFGLVFFFMPESPYYLLARNRRDDALKSLRWLRGPDYSCDEELERLQAKIDEENSNPTTFAQKFSKRASIKALIICLSLMIFQQYSGINAVLFNISTIFTNAGSTISENISSIIIGVIQVAATLLSTFVIDRLGRKILLLISSTVMGLCGTALGVYFYLLEDQQDVSSISWLPLVSLCIFIVAFSIGYGPIPWLISGELCNPDIKAFVGSSAGTFNWLLAFIITRTFLDMKTGMGMGGAFWFFAGVTFLGVVFVVIFVPETKGKSVDEMQDLLNNKKNQKV